jgi:hypothetical protein
MRRYYLGGRSPLGKGAGIVLKPFKMVSNERKGR